MNYTIFNYCVVLYVMNIDKCERCKGILLSSHPCFLILHMMTLKESLKINDPDFKGAPLKQRRISAEQFLKSVDQYAETNGCPYNLEEAKREFKDAINSAGEA